MLKKSAKIAIIAGIAVAVAISALAVTVHLRLSATEGTEKRQEGVSEKINEAINVIANPNAEHNETSGSEENESAEQREKMIQEKEMTEKEPIYDPKIIPDDFVSEINNKFFTLVPGTTFIYEGKTEDGMERNEMYVTNNTKAVLGVDTVEVWDRVWLDGELIEETLDWYAQDKSGNVWYFGEDSKEYSLGKITSTKGSWEAGVDGAKPGIIMQAEPKIGQPYRQEYYKNIAEDMAQVVSIDESVTVPYDSFTGCLKTMDWNSLEPGTGEHKYYCQDVGGVVLEVGIADGEKVELIDVKD